MSLYEQFSEQELEVLRVRAERAAQAAQHGDAEKSLMALQITLGRESYALPVELIRTVYADVTIVPVPCVPDFVAGIANIRGRILPVLDLGAYLDVPLSQVDDTCALVVVADNTMTVGFAIARVGEFITFSAEDVAPIPASADVAQTSYVRGVLPDGAGLIDIATILKDSDVRLSTVETL